MTQSVGGKCRGEGQYTVSHFVSLLTNFLHDTDILFLKKSFIPDLLNSFARNGHSLEPSGFNRLSLINHLRAIFSRTISSVAELNCHVFPLLIIFSSTDWVSGAFCASFGPRSEGFINPGLKGGD